MSKIDSMEGFKDCISRQQAIDKMQELEDEDIELFGCSIPEGFDGKRAIEALKTLPSIKPGPRFIIKSDGTIEQIKTEHESKTVNKYCDAEKLNYIREYIVNNIIIL